MIPFEVVSEYEPKGDQGKAIAELTKGVEDGLKYQTLLGVTGSGKTYTMAKLIEAVQKPTLVIAHNKTLAAQLADEFRSFFPNNAVEYFVSYYDYYQPEAYVPHSDLFIEKDSSINDEIDKLRHSATAALFERQDVIIVASVSCIYGLGSPIDYENLVLSLRPGMEKDRDEIIRKLVDIQYTRNDIAFERNNFRVRGDVLEIYPAASTDKAVRVEFFGDEIDRLTEIHTITGEITGELSHVSIFPASHYTTTPEKLEDAIVGIRRELSEQYQFFTDHNQLVEAQRILQRTNYDLEMLQEMGYCTGIENYTRYINGLPAGSPPYTLIDYFPKDFLIIADESHVSIPQIGGMSAGDRARKKNLVDYGFRLPSAYDNRPLTFDEFEGKINQIIFTTATPSKYEKAHAQKVVEQIIRPTGLVDPEIFVRPIKGQIDDLTGEINDTVSKGNRVLVTTLTKKMAEDLTDYFKENGVSVRYLHSDIDTIERMEILRDLRLGEFDVLVGINLLREGLDLPEVGLVAILDADKEGYLRSETSLVQTIGRAARNVDGKVIMYADKITKSMNYAITETYRRREIQQAYNKEHGITPQSVKKEIRNIIEVTKVAEDGLPYEVADLEMEEEILDIGELEAQMKQAASDLDFERAAQLRDKIKALKIQSE
ncbi:MAG: excinuclease ABC subunit UvrB [Eubacterium aggregans]|uniref:UvrABC system protein B n=1 Tax=Eubacterium aggregans TaxID=81409 RepID=A0A1H4B6R7_9FIRM|nr:excinuclease ABC subunit UvrB [Eubacterium aggregans]MDD4690637.1 excinuclease ABC subunit UvrB [Eubacterium aggregans]MEA5073123.1 excinuclease ABC subunit UvrB [Eubacterium aggregans]SEA43893.1 Excinuclease ABC subunit B [Eubacterium aggregans]